MNSQSDEILAKLTFLVSTDVRGQAGIAEKIGYSDPHVSEVMRRKKKVTRRFAKEIEALMKAQAKQSEPSGSIVRSDVPPYRVECEAKPIGYITNRGEKWEESVPFYADDALNEKAIRMAERLRPKAAPVPPPPQAPPAGTPSAGPSVEEAVLLAEADRLGAQVRTMSTGTVTPAKP